MQNGSAQMIDKSKFLYKGKVPDLYPLAGKDILGEDKIEYLWSRDPEDLRQYMNLVDRSYDTELDIKDAYTKITSKDFRSYYFLGKIGNKVIAGLRYTINDPFGRYTLPSERIGFSFAKAFPEFDFTDNKFAEITRMGVLPEHRNNTEHYKKGFLEFQKLSNELDITHVFILTTKERAHIYNKFGQKYFDVVATKEINSKDWDDLSNFDVIAVCYKPKKNKPTNN